MYKSGQRRVRQPQAPVRLAGDWQGILRGVYIPQSRYQDLSGYGNHLTTQATNALGRSVGKKGATFTGNNTAGNGQYRAAAVSPSYPVILVSLVHHNTSGTTAQAVFGLHGSTFVGAPFSGFYHSNNLGTGASHTYHFLGARAGTARTLSGTTLAVNRPRCVVSISRSATEHFLWVDGVEYSSVLDCGAIDDNPKHIVLGAAVQGSTPTVSSPLNGGVALAAFGYGVNVSNGKLRALSQNPWAMFESLPRHIWSAVSAGGAAPVGRADETDTALALTGIQLRAADRADETDTALALAAVQIKAVGMASETDTALPLDAGSANAVGRADETDTALALAGVQIRAVGMATETDTALALTPIQILAPGLALEIDTSFALAAVQLRAVGRADETDTALALLAGGGDPPTYTVESRRRIGHTPAIDPQGRIGGTAAHNPTRRIGAYRP